MAQSSLQLVSNTGALGGNWTKGGDSDIRNLFTAESDSKYAQHNCTASNSNTAYLSIEDFTDASYPNISSCQLYVRHGRNSADMDATIAYRDTNLGLIDSRTWPPWSNQTFTIPAPGGGWTVADVNALAIRLEKGGTTGGTAYFRVDYIRVLVNWNYYTMASLAASDSLITQNSARITGSYDAGGDGASEWRIEYKIDGGSYDAPSWTAGGSGGGSQTGLIRDLSGLSASQLYYYRLAARNENDDTVYSAEGSFTTNAATGGLIVFY